MVRNIWFTQAARHCALLIFLLFVNIPTVYSNSSSRSYELKWQGQNNAQYEVEVAKGTRENKIIRSVTDEPHYKLNFEDPATYFWRYRILKDDQSSPYTEFKTVHYKGSVKRKNPPLMEFPHNNVTALVRGDKPSFTFKWNEPDPDLQYFLAIYFNGKGPAKVIEVKGGSYTLKLKKMPTELHWRVFSKNPTITKTKTPDSVTLSYRPVNKKKYKIKLVKKLDHFKPVNPFIFRAAYYQTQTKFKIDADNINEKDSLGGRIFELNAEYFPRGWKQRKSINLHYKTSNLSSVDNELGEQKLGAEFGWVLGSKASTHHQLYAGYHFINNLKFKLSDKLNTDYDLRLISVRYLFRKQLKEKLAFEVTSSMQIPTSFNSTPSVILRPGVNYLISRHLWIDFYALYERYLNNLQGAESSDEVKIELRNFAFGVGLTWSFGNNRN